MRGKVTHKQGSHTSEERSSSSPLFPFLSLPTPSRMNTCFKKKRGAKQNARGLTLGNAMCAGWAGRLGGMWWWSTSSTRTPTITSSGQGRGGIGGGPFLRRMRSDRWGGSFQSKVMSTTKGGGRGGRREVYIENKRIRNDSKHKI